MAAAYCTNCNINWASLWQDNSRHGIDFCPCCKTDSFLIEPKNEAAYIRSFLSGDIINSVTKEPLQLNLVQTIQIKNTSEFNIEEYRKKQEAEQDKQLEAIAKYHEVFDEQGPEIAEQLYFKTHKQK